MKKLEKDGCISELTEFKSFSGKSVWRFRMGELTFHYNDKELNLDFTRYEMKIEYKSNKKPPKNLQVRIVNLNLPNGTKHTYPDGSLCLFKPSNFKWKSGMTIEKHLFTTICTWLYHYEIWEKTGVWYGEEARH